MPFWAAAASVVGGLLSSSSSSDASGAQAQSSADAVGEQRRQFDQTRADYAPYRAAGQEALGQLAVGNNTPTSAADVLKDPGYQFGLNQGQLGLDRKAAASGGRVSGASLQAASQYATNYAASGYGAAYQRGQDRLNRLAAIAGIGQTATNGSALAGAQSANAISGIMQNAGDNAGRGFLQQGNIWGNTGNQIGALYGRRNQQQPGVTPQFNYDQGSNSAGGYYGNEGRNYPAIGG